MQPTIHDQLALLAALFTTHLHGLLLFYLFIGALTHVFLVLVDIGSNGIKGLISLAFVKHLAGRGMKSAFHHLLVVALVIIVSNTIHPGSVHEFFEILDFHDRLINLPILSALYPLVNTRIDTTYLDVSRRIVNSLDSRDLMVMGIVVAYFVLYLFQDPAARKTGGREIVVNFPNTNAGVTEQDSSLEMSSDYGTMFSGDSTTLTQIGSPAKYGDSWIKPKMKRLIAVRAQRRIKKAATAKNTTATQTKVINSSVNKNVESSLDSDYAADNEALVTSSSTRVNSSKRRQQQQRIPPSKDAQRACQPPSRLEGEKVSMGSKFIAKPDSTTMKPISPLSSYPQDHKEELLASEVVEQYPTLPAYESNDSVVSMAFTEIYGGEIVVLSSFDSVQSIAQDSESPAAIPSVAEAPMVGTEAAGPALSSLPTYESLFSRSSMDLTGDYGRILNVPKDKTAPEDSVQNRFVAEVSMLIEKAMEEAGKEEEDVGIPIILLDGEEVDVSVLVEEERGELEHEQVSSPPRLTRVEKGKHREFYTPEHSPETSRFLSVHFDSPFNPGMASTPCKPRNMAANPAPLARAPLPVTPIRKSKQIKLPRAVPFEIPKWALVEVSPCTVRSPEIYVPDDLPDLPPMPPMSDDEDYDAFMSNY